MILSPAVNWLKRFLLNFHNQLTFWPWNFVFYISFSDWLGSHHREREALCGKQLDTVAKLHVDAIRAVQYVRGTLQMLDRQSLPAIRKVVPARQADENQSALPSFVPRRLQGVVHQWLLHMQRHFRGLKMRWQMFRYKVNWVGGEGWLDKRPSIFDVEFQAVGAVY